MSMERLASIIVAISRISSREIRDELFRIWEITGAYTELREALEKEVNVNDNLL